MKLSGGKLEKQVRCNIMSENQSRAEKRIRRHLHVRKTVTGTPERPRLNVFRSVAEIYAQVIDDAAGKTLATASSVDHELRDQMTRVEKSEQAHLVA